MDPFTRWFCPDKISVLDQVYIDLQDALAHIYGPEGLPRNGDWQAEEDRSRTTLLSLLSDADRACYETNRWFPVTGSEGGQYRVEYGYSGNVYRMPEWTILCAHPAQIGHPHETAMVAQLLRLRCCENRFLDEANTLGREQPR